MKKSGITVDFLINKMQEAAGIEDKEYFHQEFKKVLSENIDCLETAAIRLSDHDFGGNIDYSYMSPCINIVVNFGRYEK